MILVDTSIIIDFWKRPTKKAENVFLNEDGTGNSEKMAGDFLHLKKEGYKAWAEAIEPDIKKLLNE